MRDSRGESPEYKHAVVVWTKTSLERRKNCVVRALPLALMLPRKDCSYASVDPPPPPPPPPSPCQCCSQERQVFVSDNRQRNVHRRARGWLTHNRDSMGKAEQVTSFHVSDMATSARIPSCNCHWIRAQRQLAISNHCFFCLILQIPRVALKSFGEAAAAEGCSTRRGKYVGARCRIYGTRSMVATPLGVPRCANQPC